MHHPQLPLGNPFTGLPPNSGLSADAYISAQIFSTSRAAIQTSSLISGAVTGPATTTDRAIATWNGTGGNTLRDNSGIVIDSTGALRCTSGSAGPSAATSSVSFFGAPGNAPSVGLVDSTRSANNRIMDYNFNSGIFSMRFVNDAFSSATNFMQVTGGFAAGVTAVSINGPTTCTSIQNTPIGSVTRSTLAATSGNFNTTLDVTGAATLNGGASVRGGTAPSTTQAQTAAWMSGTAPIVSLINSGNTANNRHWYHAVGTLQYQLGVANDAFSASINALEINGGQAATITSLCSPNAAANVFGHTASVTVANAGKLQITGTTDATSQMQLSRFSADANGPNFAQSKSRSGTAGTNTIVVSGDRVFTATGYGANGTTYTPAAQIQMNIDGTPGATNDMPGNMIFLTTPDGSGALTESFRIDNAQKVIHQIDRSLRFNNQTNAAGANVGTLLNAPTAGDPGFWLKINIAGTNYALPAWAG